MLKKFLKSYLIAVVLGLLGLYALVKFFQWDEGDRDKGYRQLLPFELEYTFDGEAESYKEGNAWYVIFNRQQDDGSFIECGREMISIYDYEALRKVEYNPERLRIAPSWVFTTRSTGDQRCQLMNTDWDKFYQITPPSLELLRQYNRLQKDEADKKNAAADKN